MTLKYRLLLIIILLGTLIYPVWYAVNWYAAGLIDQTQLIEFGMDEDFIYCHSWRPELLDKNNFFYRAKVHQHSERSTLL